MEQTKELNKKIFVAAIPTKSSKDSLLEYFSKFGKINSMSKIFKIGRKNTNCCILDCESYETKEKILDEVHLFQNRYLDCKEYLRGKKLKSQIEKIQKSNVYIPRIPEKAKKSQLKGALKKVIGEISNIKIGYSVKEQSCYAIVTFAEPELAQKAFEMQSYTIKGFNLEFKEYVQAKVSNNKKGGNLGRKSQPGDDTIKEKRTKGGKALKFEKSNTGEDFEYVRKKGDKEAKNSTMAKKKDPVVIHQGSSQVISVQGSENRRRPAHKKNSKNIGPQIPTFETVPIQSNNQLLEHERAELRLRVEESESELKIGNSQTAVNEVLELSKTKIIFNHLNTRNLKFRRRQEQGPKKRRIKRRKKRLRYDMEVNAVQASSWL